MNQELITLPSVIRALGRGKTGSRNLTSAEADFTMSAILDRTITGPQLGAFLMLMRMKEETPDELAGMVNACHRALALPPGSAVQVNWPAYAGKKKQPSWYVLAAKLLAQNGVQILMHGGGEHTPGRQYASAVCHALQMPIATNLQEASQQIAQFNFSYINVENFLPRISELIDMKAELGLRSPVNTLVRHINPLNADVTLQGMFHPAYMPLHHETANRLEQVNNIVLKGDAGEFEVRPDSDTAVAMNASHQCAEAALAAVLKLRAIRPDTAEIGPLISLWKGTQENAYGEAAVLQTAALIYAQLKATSLINATETVTQWWQAR